MKIITGDFFVGLNIIILYPIAQYLNLNSYILIRFVCQAHTLKTNTVLNKGVFVAF